MRVRALVLAAAAAMCAASCAPPPVRFVDGEPVRVVHDTADIPEPAEKEFWRLSHHIENFGPRHIRLGLDPVPAPPALDVNRFGEVPSSAWYEDRGTPTPAQVAAGAGGEDPGPEAFRPWKITGMKSGGRNPGLVIEDARGVRYICKFDKPYAPVVATAAGAVAARLLWALGYHVPDDRIVFFAREQLTVAEGATDKADDGTRTPIRDEAVDVLLQTYAPRNAAGEYRVLVSRYLPGKPIGGWAYRGTRADDPNDTIPHQQRRSLRGLRVFGAWLNHVDLKEDNSLDLYTEENGRHFLRHYLVDFDGCLGGYWAARFEPRIGFAYDFDLAEVVTGIPAFGLIPRPYEALGAPRHPLVGLFEADAYDPAKWKANYVNDTVLSWRPADAFWAGTVMARLTPEHVKAAVAAARFDDPSADEELTRVLVERWEKTVDWALTRVTPVAGLDRVVPHGEGFRVEATDALVQAGRPSALRYRVEVLDDAGRRIAGPTEAGGPAAEVGADVARGREYLVVRWTAAGEAGDALPPTDAHYRRIGESWTLTGILRDGE